MARKHQSPARSASDFETIKKAYNLKSPRQIKERILWNNLKAVVQLLYGDSPTNRAKLQQFEHDWKACELQERR